MTGIRLAGSKVRSLERRSTAERRKRSQLERKDSPKRRRIGALTVGVRVGVKLLEGYRSHFG